MKVKSINTKQEAGLEVAPRVNIWFNYVRVSNNLVGIENGIKTYEREIDLCTKGDDGSVVIKCTIPMNNYRFRFEENDGDGIYYILEKIK